MQAKILRPVRAGGKSYGPGKESDLFKITSEEQRTQLLKSKLIEGDWSSDPGETKAAADAAEARANLDESTVEALEPIAAKISESFNITRALDETPVQFLERVADEAEAFGEKIAEEFEAAEKARDDANARASALDAKVTELQGELETTKGELETAKNATQATSLSALKSLDAGTIGKLVKADYDTVEKIKAADDKDLVAINGIAENTVAKIRDLLKPQGQ